MAKSLADIAKDVSASLLMQVIALQAENEQLKEDLAKLQAEKKEKEDASKPVV